MNKITNFCTSDLYMTMLELGRKFPTKSKHREETCKYVDTSYPRIKPLKENTISYVITTVWSKLSSSSCIVILIYAVTFVVSKFAFSVRLKLLMPESQASSDFVYI